jgi:hypothetical protein
MKGGIMNINELVDIMKEHGVNKGWRVSIGGCELLEHISDVPGFVSLLGEFRRLGSGVNLVENYDPIGFILNVDITFCADGDYVYISMDDDLYYHTNWFERELNNEC